MTHTGYPKLYWDSKYVAKALEMSSKALNEYLAGDQYTNPSITGFLSRRKSFFLIGPRFCTGGTVLVECGDVGDKWGADDFMLSLPDQADIDKKKMWLELAASFGGALYLVDLSLSEEEEAIWWQALQARKGKICPNSLFLLSDSTEIQVKSTDELMRTLPRVQIKNLAVYNTSLFFSSIGTPLAIPLDTLHLEQVSMESSFRWALSQGRVFDVSHSLSLINIPSTDHVTYPISDCFEMLQPQIFLGWQLKHLSLEGFYRQIELIPFMERLRKCTNVSLQSLSLEGSVSIPDEADPACIGAVVDALHMSSLPFLNLGGLEKHPSIQAQLQRNQRSRNLRQQPYSKVPAKSVRLFICGDAYAGKTTLLSTMASHPGFFSKLKVFLKRFQTDTLERTRGIEIHTISRDDIHLSVWDMAGQTEFHAFHDFMIPDPSATHGSPAMFMYVWSPVDSKNERPGKSKNQQDFESSFCYWLKFITSKTRQSNILRKLTVVLTRKDQMELVGDALEHSIHAFSTTFSESIQVVKVLEVDARSKASVEPLVSYIFQTAHDILKDVKVYSICNQVSQYLSRGDKGTSVVEQPIISWNDFTELCGKQFHVSDPEVHKAIAYSLHESGDIIYLGNLPFLVLDPNWFCHEVMGSLIHFPQPGTNKAIIPINGYAKREYLEKVLRKSSNSMAEGSVLLALMEAMHICCRVPGDANGMVFIPATLSNPTSVQHLQWRGAIGGRSSMQQFTYVGRRLECDKKDLTFLTPGLFPMMQVAFNNAFCETNDDMKLGKADVQMGKRFMSICVQDSEIIVEWGLVKGDNVIDVMIRAPNDEDVGYTLALVEDKIVRTVIGVCAQPVGNQGVRLVEGVIRPDCLHAPSPPHVREDQCASILDLKQELKKQLEGGRPYEKLLHFWGGNNHLKPITSRFIDLLGPKEFMKVLMSYKASLEESLRSVPSTTTASTSGLAGQEVGGEASIQKDADAASTSRHAGCDEAVGDSTASPGKILRKHGTEAKASNEWLLMEENAPVSPNENEQVVDALSKSMVKEIYRKLHSMDGKLEGLKQSVDSMHGDIGTQLDTMYKNVVSLRAHALPRVQNLVEQSLNFAIENEAGKIPRFVFLTTDEYGAVTRRRMVNALIKGLKSVRIELFCEHREGPHRVVGQKGLSVTIVGDEMIKRALPYVNRFLKVLTLVAKVGVHVCAGAGSMVPDLSQLVALAIDTPGVPQNQGFLSNVSSSPEEDFNGWQQWLVSVLEKNGGMKESNITSKFQLRRVLYKDTSKVAWLCDMHYKDQCPLPLV